MAKKRKKKRGGAVATGGAIGLILFFLFNGNFSLDLLGTGNNGDNNVNDTQVEEQVDEEVVEAEDVASDIFIEIDDNTITVNGKVVLLDNLLSEIGENTQIILRASNAKQVTYDEVKTLLNEKDIVIVEE